jgi:hypothetical protein
MKIGRSIGSACEELERFAGLRLQACVFVCNYLWDYLRVGQFFLRIRSTSALLVAVVVQLLHRLCR